MRCKTVLLQTGILVGFFVVDERLYTFKGGVWNRGVASILARRRWRSRVWGQGRGLCKVFDNLHQMGLVALCVLKGIRAVIALCHQMAPWWEWTCPRQYCLLLSQRACTAASLSRLCGDGVGDDSCHLFTEIISLSQKISDSSFSNPLYLMSSVQHAHYCPVIFFFKVD